jgi:CHASE2 domain-containing sensor protein
MEADLLSSEDRVQVYDAFISYGRADSKAFAFKLYDQLTAAGYSVWLDFNDIPLAVDFQEQINSGIECSENFLFIIAPHSINSPYCRLEIELALKCNKRIIPLLHVEQIDQQTWQHRNPNGTEEQWHDYKTQGLHSSFPNMHPAIGKINWVYFREEIDNFETALIGLTSALERHKSYVYQHTVLLTKALYWSRHQRKISDLLTGAELESAELWLKTRFKGEQPPCKPVALHGEFITESIKNEQNLMAQVFLSYADEDREWMETIRTSLWNEGITVWSNKNDIRIGEDFVLALRRGIEQSDNLVYLFSPNSLQSSYCQIELEYAYQLNKRIVPLLLSSVDMAHIPVALKDLQYIDLSNLANRDDYHNGEIQLLNTLQQNAHYHRQHKLLLFKALKWQQQQHNPSLLLRGRFLRQAEAWLKESAYYPQFPPLPIHQTLIATSQQQPPDQTFNLFICYSSRDGEFTRKLNDNLQLQGMTTWFDQEIVENEQDMQLIIQQGIENAENFLFVLSPNSLRSPDCLQQHTYAQSLNKRQIIVLCQDISVDELPASLSYIQQIDFRQHREDLLRSFGELIRSLVADPDYIQLHTRLLVKAKEWLHANRDDDLLLHGKQLQAVGQWLISAETKDPKPTQLQRDYIQASRAVPLRKIKLRSMLLTSTAVTVLVAIARLFGVLQPLELKAYDTFMQLRPNEQPDSRLLIVKVDASSGSLLRQLMINKTYQPSISTIPDTALNDVLGILEAHQPRLIGLDFYRDFPAEPMLQTRFNNASNIISNCLSKGWQGQGNAVPNLTGTKPETIGFANVVTDGQNRFVRRHYLMQDTKGICSNPQAFNLILVRNYLKLEGKSFTNPFEGATVGTMRFGDTAIPLLDGNGSGYAWFERSLGGYQTLLNYRISGPQPSSCLTTQSSSQPSSQPAENVADTVTFADVLQKKVAADCIRDRIVLIGYTDTTDRNADVWITPYGRIAGVFLQGQMVSQLLSAVLDGRSLIWWLPLGLETGWIWVWSVTGGIVFWRLIRPHRLVVVTTGVLGFLMGGCYGVLVVASGWLPVVPAAIALGLSGAGVAYLSYRIRHPWS